MANNPENQRQFIKDVAASAAAGNDEFFNVNDPYGRRQQDPDEVWKVIEQLQSLNDEERTRLREHLYSSRETSEYLKKRIAKINTDHISWGYMTFAMMIAIIILVFALFGYKLYKSLKEKELKKQEKLKHKQSKKIKKIN